MTNTYKLGATLTAAAIAGLVLVPGASFARGGGLGGGIGVGAMGGGATSHIGGMSSSTSFGGARAGSTTRAGGMSDSVGTNGFGANGTMTVTGSRIPVGIASHAATAPGTANANASAMTPDGGQSSANISASGRANSNGPNAATRVFGRARAAARHALHSSHTMTDPDDRQTMPKHGSQNNND